jgi:hypothetical protein
MAATGREHDSCRIWSTGFGRCLERWKKQFCKYEMTDDVCAPLQFVALRGLCVKRRCHNSTEDYNCLQESYALRNRRSNFGSFDANSLAAAAQEGKSPRSNLIKWTSLPVTCFNFSRAGSALAGFREQQYTFALCSRRA